MRASLCLSTAAAPRCPRERWTRPPPLLFPFAPAETEALSRLALALAFPPPGFVVAGRRAALSDLALPWPVCQAERRGPALSIWPLVRSTSRWSLAAFSRSRAETRPEPFGGMSS